MIIGKNGLIGKNLFNYFKSKKINIYRIGFKSFLKNKNINNFDIIINCTSNHKFVKNKYENKNDNDLIIAEKIINLKTKLVMLSTRKIYKTKFNIKELDKKEPNCNYSKNKIISEISVRKILANKVLILRISNIISYPNSNKRKLHKTFSDIFFEMAKKGFIYKNNKAYKDFISIKKFNQIVLELIKKNSFGLFVYYCKYACSLDSGLQRIFRLINLLYVFFFSSIRRHTRSDRDCSSEVCSFIMFFHLTSSYL